MLISLWAEIQAGQIRPIEPVELPEGTRLLITLMPEDDAFWQQLSEKSLAKVWDNTEDDVYAQLLQK